MGSIKIDEEDINLCISILKAIKHVEPNGMDLYTLKNGLIKNIYIIQKGCNTLKELELITWINVVDIDRPEDEMYFITVKGNYYLDNDEEFRELLGSFFQGNQYPAKKEDSARITSNRNWISLLSKHIDIKWLITIGISGGILFINWFKSCR